jgi:hypothetical protein
MTFVGCARTEDAIVTSNAATPQVNALLIVSSFLDCGLGNLERVSTNVKASLDGGHVVAKVHVVFVPLSRRAAGARGC